MTWERIYTVNSFYDCPRLGVADFDGKPHIFESPFDEEADDYSEDFLLVEIEPALLALVLEDWGIWLRWKAAYLAGEALASHPALPTDRARHDELRGLIGERFTAQVPNATKMRARFRNRNAQSEGEVEWLPLAPA